MPEAGTVKLKTLPPILPGAEDMRVAASRALEGGYIWIPGEVPSKKNSKQIKMRGPFRPKLESSAFTKRYEQATGIFYNQQMHRFRKMANGHQLPLQVQFLFYRRSKQRFDYGNIGQIVWDMMVQYRWLDDDDADHMIPFFKPYIYDPCLFGVEIRIL